ncbi:MAG: sucrose-6-phosphate hydrolase [Eggerthia catenaformis]|uniref:sucrose-6-phosphate hydrolase n=1 Tax=Eggerthia catenaformis TaxID=31973 RepID=UPI003FA18744
MKEFTQEERYRVLKSPDEIKDLHQRNAQSIYRQTYHVQPVTGLSSDPNGFVYHNNLWHLFYQWTPWGAVHGLKYWYHVTSKDLVHWSNRGIGLSPGDTFDNKGCHSGSGIALKNDLYLFYTGNHRDEKWIRTPYTCAARMDENGKLHKLKEPLFGPRPDYAEHQRDPKVIYHKQKDMYYIFIGAMTLDKRGTVLIYQSKDLLSGWQFSGELKVPGYENFGGMWECPCIENLNGQDILIFSPQYTKLPERGNSTNHNVYLTGQMDYETLTFTPSGPYHYLDYGFDFYAAQFAANINSNDHAIMISWIGLPDNHYPSAEDEWEGTMTIPRVVSLKDGYLYQQPPEEMKLLRKEPIPTEGHLPDTCEIEALFDGEDTDFNLFTNQNSHGLKIHYQSDTHTLTFDKSHMKLRFNQQVFEILNIKLAEDLKNMQIFIDKCSLEVFINDGKYTFTARLFPVKEEHNYVSDHHVKLTIYPLKESVQDNFIL